MNFEALSSRSYIFNCVDCRYQPPILIVDLNRNVGFKYGEGEEELN